MNPHDPDVRITKMKDGRTHLAHKAELAFDLETGAVGAVTLAAADEGDTATLQQTVPQAGHQPCRGCGHNHGCEGWETLSYYEFPREHWCCLLRTIRWKGSTARSGDGRAF